MGTKDGVLAAPNAGVWAEPNKDGVDPKGVEIWGEIVFPNKENVEAEADGVENIEEEGTAAAGADDAGVLKNENPLPNEEADNPTEDCGAPEVAAVAELENKPATCVDGWAGMFNVGWILLAAASSLAVSRRSASRKGSWASPRRLWSTR